MGRSEPPRVNRPALLALALCSLVALSGCAAVDEVTHPHAPTTKESPPGVDDSGVTNATKLLRANAFALGNAGYAARLTANGSVRRSESKTVRANVSVVRRIRADSNRSYFRYRIRSAKVNGSTAVWRNGTVAVARAVTGNETHYTSTRISREILKPDRWALASNPFNLRTILVRTNWSITDVDRPLTGGSTQITLHPSDSQKRASIVPTQRITNATLVVDSDGAIRELAYTATYGRNRKGRVRVRYRVTDLGVDRVDRPAWVATALGNRTN